MLTLFSIIQTHLVVSKAWTPGSTTTIICIDIMSESPLDDIFRDVSILLLQKKIIIHGIKRWHYDINILVRQQATLQRVISYRASWSIIIDVPVDSYFDPQSWLLNGRTFIQSGRLGFIDTRLAIYIEFALWLAAHVVKGVGMRGVVNRQMGLYSWSRWNYMRRSWWPWKTAGGW